MFPKSTIGGGDFRATRRKFAHANRQTSCVRILYHQQQRVSLADFRMRNQPELLFDFFLERCRIVSIRQCLHHIIPFFRQQVGQTRRAGTICPASLPE
jgi:hypothetical protein